LPKKKRAQQILGRERKGVFPPDFQKGKTECARTIKKKGKTRRKEGRRGSAENMKKIRRKVVANFHWEKPIS